MGKEYSVLIKNQLGVCVAKREDLEYAQGGVSGVVKFRNIKYASIPYRWSSPRLVKESWRGVANLQHYGPGCPQTNEPLFDVDGIPLFGKENRDSISIQPKFQDEFECLNLNIFAPSPIKSDKGVPVLIWIHGGAYCVGSGGTVLYGKKDISFSNFSLTSRWYRNCAKIYQSGRTNYCCYSQL